MKNNIKLIITIIGVIMLVGLGITFAYYSINITGNPTSENIEIGAGTVSLVFSDGTSTINAQNILPGWTSTKTFTVTNTSSVSEAQLEYNIKLVITENGFASNSFKYSLAGTGSGALNKSDTDITSNDILLGAAKITGTGTVHTYTLTLTYKNLNTDQSADMGKTFSGYVTITSGSQIAQEPESSGGGMAEEIIANASEEDGLYDYGTAGYRYSGATPNNYVEFPIAGLGEWRIIGFIDGSQIGKEAGTYYTKIIRNESIGDKEWDSNFSNTWYTSTLYSELNGTAAYINNTNVEAVNWYHKASDNRSVLTSAQYTAEAWGTTCSTSSKNCTSNAKVGIMSPSDYGYAASSTCQSGYNLNSYDNSTCTGSNWLYINNTIQWLLQPNASYSSNARRVNSGGSVDIDSLVTNSYAVRPVVYLKPSTAVSGEDGKVGSPYTIG